MQMNKIFVSNLEKLQVKLEGSIHWDTLHKALFATDASVYRKLPTAVAFPKTTADIQLLIEFARNNNTSLIPRTAGTSLAGQCVGEGIVVDVSKYFTKIISLDTNKKQITVQPGVIRDELNRYLKQHGLFFGPNTSTSNRCMIGGMVGNNSSGTTSIQYGVTRDKVISLTTILSDGAETIFTSLSKEAFQKKVALETIEGTIYKTIYNELSNKEKQHEIRMQFPKPEIHRRNTGYAIDLLLDNSVFEESENEINMCNLLCGSEGTLAFTTEITLQLDELPPSKSAMVATHYKSIETCLNDVTVAMQHDLYTCEMMDKVILDCTKENKKQLINRFFVEGDPAALLLLEVRAHTEAEIDKKVFLLCEALKNSGFSYANPILRGKQIDQAMELRKAGLGLLGNIVGDKKAVACIEDTAVALEDLSSFINEFTVLMKSFKQDAVYYAHAGAGEIHLRPILNLKDNEDVKHFRAITSAVAILTKKYKGSFSGEHGDGIVRSEFIPFMIGEQNYEILKKIKWAFDPQNIFNPGKIVASYKMDVDFRYESNREEPIISTFFDFSSSEGILRVAEKCNGSGDCRKLPTAGGTMCPSYHATRNEKDTTRARANALREFLTNSEEENKFNHKELKEVFDLCLSCKACASECPSNVDVASLKAEFLYQYNKSNTVAFSDKLFGKSSKYNRLASRIPVISNWFFSNKITSAIIKNSSGIASERSLPKISSKPFGKLHKQTVNKAIRKNISICLFIDEFSNYLDADIAKDAFTLLNELGYNITIIDSLDSARALLSKGFLEEAKMHIDKNINYLKNTVSKTNLLVGIEPSAIFGFKDEYIKLASDKASAREIAKNTYLIEEFLCNEFEAGKIVASQFTSKEKKIKIHVHCHQKALSNQKITFDILNIPINYKPTLIPSGCCGMAGSFGYEKKHYKISMQIGEQTLFPAIRKASENTVIAANGTSCRHQIKDGTGRKSQHPVTILKNALNENNKKIL